MAPNTELSIHIISTNSIHSQSITIIGLRDNGVVVVTHQPVP